ncbi:MAG: hypothetical protein CML68_05610 [Rhodobacteraceae bacterium]|nr:hypothetical protein [Paracoccaceae bacterium]
MAPASSVPADAPTDPLQTQTDPVGPPSPSTQLASAQTPGPQTFGPQTLDQGPDSTPSPVPSGDACFDLWYRRSAIFQGYGYCFQTAKAQQYFDTSACTTRAPQLSAADTSRVDSIRAQERADGC